MATRGSAAWRREVWGKPCQAADIVAVQWLPHVRLWVCKRAVAAFEALATVVERSSYVVRQEDTGSFNCRAQKGNDLVTSSHAWGLAVDINWTTNPYSLKQLRTDLPPALVEEVLQIRTGSGAQVWRWGGDWDGRPETPHSNYDAMHFEIVATPWEVGTGVEAPPSVHTLPELRRGARGPAVAQLQRLLGVLGPATFGPKTEEAVRQFQRSHQLRVDGVVGPATWRALLAR